MITMYLSKIKIRLLSFFGLGLVLTLSIFVIPAPLASSVATDTVTLSTEVTQALSLNLSSGSLSLGAISPGTPVRGSGGIVVSILTSAANGYNLGISDGVNGNDSALTHTDGSTRIPDATALIDAPAAWVNGVTKGLGVTVFTADTSKEEKWGTGSSYNDANNKFAGIPETAVTIHSSPGYKEPVDNTSISFILDVENTQKTGIYAGDVVLTATAILI